MLLRNILGWCGFASATSVIVPLYIWPGPGGPSNWQPLLNTIANYPSVSFTVVINPDSGPGAASGPDTDFAPSVAALNSYPNVLVVGYVHTSYGAEDINTIEANITKYANWNTYANTQGNQNTTISGIFFDEVEYRDESKVDYMHSVGSFAKSNLQTSANTDPYTIYNPGTKEPAGYFTDVVDLVIQSEVAFSNYSPDNTIAGFTNGTICESAVIVHDATGETSTITDYVSRAAAQDVGAIYFTADCCYHVVNQDTIYAVAAGLV